MATQTLLIGISGKARAGKDTFGVALVDALRADGIDARRYAFADALKVIARVEHKMTAKDATLLQKLGVWYRESKGADVWVDALKHTIAEDAPRVAVITDMRFPNELAFVRDAKGLAIRVEREYVDAARDPHHVSEVALDGERFDFTIRNTRSREVLLSRAEELVFTRILPALTHQRTGEETI